MAATDDLLLMFNNMGTTDHDVLVNQFQNLAGAEDPNICRFFLEANNWSLQHAIASYFDNAGSLEIYRVAPPQIAYLGDVSPDAWREVQPGAPFHRVYRLKNSGHDEWPDNCGLVFSGGDRLAAPDFMRLPRLAAGAEYDLELTLAAPAAPGQYACCWRCMTKSESGILVPFGEPMWVVVGVGQPLDISQLDFGRLGLGEQSSWQVQQQLQQQQSSAME